MSALWEQDGITLYCGDCLKVLDTLPERSVQCCVTSPPYFALRSYLPKDHPDKPLEIGSEPTPEAFIQTMVEVFRTMRRILRDDGLLFLNLGDSYGVNGGSGEHKPGGMDYGRKGRTYQQVNHRTGRDDLSGQLLNIPHRVAEALRQDGWIWRQTIVWAKRSPMPESISGWKWVRCRVKAACGSVSRRMAGDNTMDFRNAVDPKNGATLAQWLDCPGCPKCEPNGGYVLRRGSGRCTTAHEYVFILAKSSRYFWDGEASKEEATSTQGGACVGANGNKDAGARKLSKEENAAIRSGTRNMRSVWTLSSEPTTERHFATFPSELVRRCLVAGVSAGGCCPTCGSPWAPVVESEPYQPRGEHRQYASESGHHNPTGKTPGSNTRGMPNRNSSVACYRPTCPCPAADPVGCAVLDPFSGLATVAQTTRQLGCRAIGIELNPVYHEVACRRVLEPPRWWVRKQKPKSKSKSKSKSQLSLF